MITDEAKKLPNSGYILPVYLYFGTISLLYSLSVCSECCILSIVPTWWSCCTAVYSVIYAQSNLLYVAGPHEVFVEWINALYEHGSAITVLFLTASLKQWSWFVGCQAPAAVHYLMSYLTSAVMVSGRSWGLLFFLKKVRHCALHLWPVYVRSRFSFHFWLVLKFMFCLGKTLSFILFMIVEL